jgi:hypothetical protein
LWPSIPAFRFSGCFFAAILFRSAHDPRVPSAEPASDPPKNRGGFLLIRLFLGLFLLAGLGVLWTLTLDPLWRALLARSWEPAPCRILASEVETVPGSDSDSFRVKITYRYAFRGQRYTSSQFNFGRGSSSVYNWKAKVVADLPPGRETECFVNPRNPAEAVIERTPRAEIWFGLFGLPFIAVGCMAFKRLDGVRFVRTGGGAARTVARQSRRASPAERVEEEGHEDGTKPGWRVLKPAASRGQQAFIIAGVAIFWNAVTWAVLLGQWHSGLRIEWGPVAFCSIFVLGGLLIIGAAIHRILSLFNPTLRVSIEKGALRLGGTRGLEWEFQGATRRIRTFTVTLEGSEVATYSRGTNTVTERRVFAKEELFTDHDPLSMARGAAEIRVPADSMHTFLGGNNSIVWLVRMRGEIPMFPDVNDEFPVIVGSLRPLPSPIPA